jgi:hypothetical protein
MSTRRSSKSDPLARYIAEVVLVTPELANEWLALPHMEGTEPRAFRKQRGELYAGDMSAGRWRMTSTGIGMVGYLGDGTARITNGRHRLYGVVESGVAQVFVVIQGLEPESLLFEDAGAPRTFADNLQMMGVKNPKLKSTITRATYHLMAPEARTTRVMATGGSRVLVSHQTLCDWYLGHQGMVDTSVVWASRGWRAFKIESAFPIAWMAAHLKADMAGVNAEPVSEFFDRLCVAGPPGTGLAGRQAPMDALRYWLRWSVMELPKGDAKPRPGVIAIMVIRAWNAEQQGVDRVRQMVWDPAEELPEIEVPKQ